MAGLNEKKKYKGKKLIPLNILMRLEAYIMYMYTGDTTTQNRRGLSPQEVKMGLSVTKYPHGIFHEFG